MSWGPRCDGVVWTLVGLVLVLGLPAWLFRAAGPAVSVRLRDSVWFATRLPGLDLDVS